jgi:L-cysteine desulfidase
VKPAHIAAAVVVAITAAMLGIAGLAYLTFRLYRAMFEAISR